MASGSVEIDYSTRPQLARLLDKQIMGINVLPDGRTEFYDNCDGCFGVVLTKTDILALADELKELALLMPDTPPINHYPDES